MSENVPSETCAQCRLKSDAQPYSLIIIFVVRMKKLCIHGWQNALSEKSEAQSDLNHRWAHMYEGTFSDVAATFVLCFSI